MILAILAALTAGILGASHTLAGEPAEAEAAAALAWLHSQQLDNGAFQGFSGEADGSATADAVFAFAAAGIHPETVKSSAGNDPVTYIRQQIGDFGDVEPKDAAGGVSKTILALHTAGYDPRTAGELDLIELLNQAYDQETRTYGAGIFVHSLALLALASGGNSPVEGAVETLTKSQQQDGGWSFTGGSVAGTADSNTTAIVIQALAQFDSHKESIVLGVEFLRGLQAVDGSFAFDGSAAPNLAGDANSTALVVQALVAAGVAMDSLPGGNPVDALTGFQNPSGAFHWQPAFPDDNFLATAQSIPALHLQPLPISQVPKPDLVSDLIEAAQPSPPIDGCEYHEITSHNVCAPFIEFWNTNGGLRIFGYPLTERFEVAGIGVQYFERTIFEWHTDNAGTEWEVLLRRVGADLIEAQLEE